MMETATFSGVRFALVGFNPIDGNTLRSKLVSGGGVDVGQYSQTCTHLIVDKLVYDDPICVAARSSGKVVVTGSWVDHSFDTGMLIDANSVLYRPLKDLNGIPGCKSFVVCLTGYQRQDRDDIMTMVDLMGAHFSKPLVANKVTHLICYKFEGEKYELAKRMKRIKVVNHRWLEDCLKNWKLLPEVDYEISGYELEMMEASARDSEDEVEDASLKRENTSPLGLRVAQTPGGSSSICYNTSKDHWLTPKKTDSIFEATVSTADAGVAQQHNNFSRASTFQATSNISVADKTPEQGRLSVTVADGSTSIINKSITRHSSLATYSRKTLQRSSETTTLGKESSALSGSMRMPDKALNASTPSNTSASKSASSVVFDKIHKLHGHDTPPPVSPQVKFTEGSLSSKGSHEVHHNSEARFLPPASLLLQDLRPSSPDENFRPLPSIKDPTESAEVGHKTPASVLNTKLLSSNVVPMEDATSTAENVISNCAPDEIPEKSMEEPVAGSVLLQEPRPGSPKQNLRDVPNLSGYTAGREAAYKLDLSDSAARLFNSGVVPMDADTENFTLKGAMDEIPERPVNGPVLRRSSTSPGSSLNGMKDEQEIELPKKKTAPRKSLGTRGRKKNPINQKGSIYLREHSPKDGLTDCLNKGNVSAQVTDNVHQKEISSPVPERAKSFVDSETEALKGIDSADNKSYASKEKDRLVLDLIVNQDDLQAKTSEEADAEVEIAMVEPDLNDVPIKDPSDIDKNKSKRKREAIVAQSSLQSGKKESSCTTQVGNSSVKKTKVSRKEHEAKANDTVMKDIEDNSAEEKENLASETEVGKARSGGDQRPVAGETVASKEAATKDPNDAVVELQVEKNKGKRRKDATVAKTWLHSGKKGSSSTVEVSKSCDKKTKISKMERVAKATNAVIEDVGNNSAEEKDRKSGNIASGGNENLVSGKSLTRKKVAKSANTGTKADKEFKQLSVKPLAGRKVLQGQEYEPMFFTVSGPRSQRNEYQQIIRSLKGKCCRDSHQWSYQATHFIASEIRRTEKFFAAAASGSWILKTDYVADSKEAGKLLPEEPYEWHSSGLSADGAINLEAPRKWRLVREKTGHGALNGLRIVVYGDCTIPSLDTLKRAVKAGDGTILATAPPYTRFLNQNTDFALISPGTPRDDFWIQEFIRHEIPCVLSDYIVEYVCKPGFALDKHVLYNTNSWAERSFNKMQLGADVCTN